LPLSGIICSADLKKLNPSPIWHTSASVSIRQHTCSISSVAPT
jgi:hypothetical protein